ncbi:MAG: flagellin lysine-N-methylase [Ruminococcus sp.]|nr:flagellin lysine-N-methylase [Ruminococcus sp.]
MQEIFPRFYSSFRCIANRCEDSCCKDWDIDIDSKTEAFYQSVQGELGEKIRRKLVTDDDGERVFRAENGRCPFWNQDMLCDIFIGIGEEHLSETCANFPRVRVDYDVFGEHLLSFACPEAARIMLRADGDAYAELGGADELNAAEAADGYLSFLLKARARSAQLLRDRSLPFAYRLADCLEFNAQVQSILQDREPQPLAPAQNAQGSRFIFDLHLGFEIMSDRWKKALTQAADNAEHFSFSDAFERDFEKFALYYLYRYYLEAVRSGDVLYSLRRMVCAYFITGRLDADFAAAGYPLERMRILQRYSKEVEHSYENTEALNAAFDSDERFSVENLMALLEATVA